MKTTPVLKASMEQADSATQGNPSQAELEMRSRAVAEAAYYRAEARGFVPGYEEEDWIAAEAEIALSLPASESSAL
jgi:hypothetical protein